MPTCNAAALVPATATTSAHVHECARHVMDADTTHLGEHCCGSCGKSFVATATAPTATEKCQACGAVHPLANLREMYPEPDVTQYVCLDTTACSARVKGRHEHDGRWPLTAAPQTESGDLYQLLARPVEPAPRRDPAEVVPGLSTALGVVEAMRANVEQMAHTTARLLLLRHLSTLERLLIEYRPPMAELTEVHIEPGIAERLDDLQASVDKLTERIAPAATPLYVHHLLDAFLTGDPLNFHDAAVPLDVQRRLKHAVATGRMGTVPAHPAAEMVWLGDLSGYEVDVTEDGPNPQLIHRCGWHVALHGPGRYLANIIHDQVRTHMRDGCQQA